MLFSDDIVLIGDNREKVNQRLNGWRLALEGKRLRIKIIIILGNIFIGIIFKISIIFYCY